MKKFLLRKVTARMLSFLIIALAFVCVATWGRWQSVANATWPLALVLLVWDWQLDVIERKE